MADPSEHERAPERESPPPPPPGVAPQQSGVQELLRSVVTTEVVAAVIADRQTNSGSPPVSLAATPDAAPPSILTRPSPLLHPATSPEVAPSMSGAYSLPSTAAVPDGDGSMTPRALPEVADALNVLPPQQRDALEPIFENMEALFNGVDETAGKHDPEKNKSGTHVVDSPALGHRRPARAPGCCERVAAFFRTIQTSIMALILLVNTAVLALGFKNLIASDAVKGWVSLPVYALCSVLTYYLEGGQAARFMAMGMPPSLFASVPRARRFIVMDTEDPHAILTYMGVRQFLTLGITTVAGGVVVPFLNIDDVCNDIGLGSGAGPAIILVSHLLFTTTLCQVLPQIRAERQQLLFLGRWGTLLTYYACDILGKVVDPSLVAERIHVLLVQIAALCPGANTPPVVAVEEEFSTVGVVKYPSKRWPSPSLIAERFSEQKSLMDAREDALAVPSAERRIETLTQAVESLPGAVEGHASRYLLPPAHSDHVPAHVIVAMAQAAAATNAPTAAQASGDLPDDVVKELAFASVIRTILSHA